MRKDKELAFKLRREGKTYSEITETLNVSGGTLSGWFRGETWSTSIKQKNTEDALANLDIQVRHMNAIRAKRLAQSYIDAKTEADTEFVDHCDNPYFIAGLMLYIGEGDKSLANNMVRITNTDPFVLRMFLFFFINFCKVPKETVRAWILLYPDLSPSQCLNYWSKAIGLPVASFYKSQVIQGKHKTKKLHYGVGTIIIGRKRLKVKILRWVELISQKMERDAGMV